jgi:hypothetical protein
MAATITIPIELYTQPVAGARASGAFFAKEALEFG